MVSLPGLKILVASAALSLTWVSTASAQRGGSNGYSQAQIDAIIQQFQQGSGSSGSSGSGSSGSGSGTGTGSGSSGGSGTFGSGGGSGGSLFSSSGGSGSSGSGGSGSSGGRSGSSTTSGGGGARVSGGGSSNGGGATITQQQGGFIGGNSGENFIGGNLNGQNGGGQQGGNRRTGGGGGSRQLDQGMMNQLNGGNGGGTASTKPTIRPRLKTAFTYPQTNVGNVVSSNRIRFEKLTVRYPQLNQVQIDSAENGRIILTGTVDSPETAKLAENLMRLEPGVRSIDNQLAVGTAGLPAVPVTPSPQ